MSTAETQGSACQAASRYWRGQQSGPKPKSKEAVYLADLLVDAARTLALVAQHRDAFAAIVRAGPKGEAVE